MPAWINGVAILKSKYYNTKNMYYIGNIGVFKMSSKPLKMSFKEKNNTRTYMPKYKMPFLHILRSKGLDPFG